MEKKKFNIFKKPINPFTLIFWAFIAVVMAILGLLFRRKKAGQNKK